MAVSFEWFFIDHKKNASEFQSNLGILGFCTFVFVVICDYDHIYRTRGYNEYQKVLSTTFAALAFFEKNALAHITLRKLNLNKMTHFNEANYPENPFIH